MARTGRPSKITQVVGRETREGPDGQIEVVDVLIWQQIVQSLRAGNYFETACAAAGIHKDTAYGWLKRAALLRTAHNGQRPQRPSKNDTACLDFSDAVSRADAEWEARVNVQLEMLGRGGATTTVVTEKVNAETGQVTERTIRTETLPADGRVLMWRLERKHPERYGHRVELNPGPVDGLSPSERAQGVLDAIEAMVTSGEIPPPREDDEAEVLEVEVVPDERALPPGEGFTFS